MISILNSSPENVAAFYTSGTISESNFNELLIPHLESKFANHKQLNYIIYINDPCEDFGLQLLLRDSLIKIESISKLKRFAIVSNLSDERIYYEFFRTIPEFDLKMFKQINIYNALYWCNNGYNNMNI